MKKILLAGTCCLAMAGTAMAQDDDGWSGEASASAAVTTGNTETTDVGLGIALANTQDIWEHQLNLTFDYGEASNNETKNRTFAGYQVNRDFTDTLYGYGNASWLHDEFGAFEDDAFIGLGLGATLIDNENPTKWTIDGGPGYRMLKASNGTENNEFAVRGGSRFSYAFNDAVTLSNNTEVLWSDADTYIWNDVNITAKLAGALSARFGVRVDYHTDPALGLEQTDTITRGALVYSIN